MTFGQNSEILGLHVCANMKILTHSAILANCLIVDSIEAPSKTFLLFFLLPDWLKTDHLNSRMECGFSDIFRAIFVPP